MNEEAIAAFTEALLKPLRDVGALLAREVDLLDAQVRELQQHVKALQEQAGK